MECVNPQHTEMTTWQKRVRDGDVVDPQSTKPLSLSERLRMAREKLKGNTPPQKHPEKPTVAHKNEDLCQLALFMSTSSSI